jgi:hypothetical protein
MATFTVDLLTGDVFLFTFDVSGGGTGGTSGGTGFIEGVVNTFADLPSAASSSNEIYIVLQSTGQYVLNRNEAGLYFSNGTVWRRLGDIPSFFNSDNFQVYDGTDNTKGVEFVLTGLTTNVFRQVEFQDKDGTVAYLVDLDAKVDITAFNDYTGTTAPAQFVDQSDFNTYSGSTLSLINGKQDQLTAGNNISIVGNVISVTGITSQDVVQLKDISGGTEVNEIIPVAITWTTQEFTGNSINFTGGSRIYIQQSGSYFISYTLNVNNDTNGRKNVGTVIRKNGNIEITPTSSASYVRNNANDAGTNTMPDYRVNLLSGDYIELYAFRVGSAGSVTTVPDGSFIKITKN